MALLAVIRSVPRARPRVLAIFGIVVLVSTASGLSAAWADAPSSESVTVTPAEIDQALNHYFRDEAIIQAIRQKLVDRAAEQAGVSVSPQDIGFRLTQWNSEQSDGGGAGLGDSPDLRREEAREELLAEKIVTATTHLVDSDFDRVEVQRVWCPTLKEAQNAYMTLVGGHTLGSNQNPQLLANIQPLQRINPEVMDGLNQGPQELGNIQVFRYDQRVGPAAESDLFTLPRGSVIPPTFTMDPPGYQVLIVASQTPASSLSQLDRQPWARVILQNKIKEKLQEWWTAIDKRVQSSKALAGGTSAAPLPTAAPPATAQPATVKAPPMKSDADTSGGGAIVLPPPGPGQ